MRLKLLALAACLFPWGVSSLDAQDVLARTVTGLIVDSVSGRPVRGAIAYFDIQRAEREADRDGRFAIEHVSIGDTVLVVRSIGYVPARVVVPASSATSIDVGRVTMRPVATRLDEIAVSAEAVQRYPQLEQFYLRKQRGQAGEFITDDEIQQTGVQRTSDLLHRSPKLEVTCNRDPVKSGTEGCIARDRRGVGYRVADGNSSRCDKEIFVDGKLSRLAIDEIPVDRIAGVEIYAGPATTPANFGQRRCGVIAIWTKGAGSN